MLIILDNVSYVYNKGFADEKTALDNISLTIEKGEFIGIIGKTGSGKSTLAKHLNGLMKATSGSIYFEGKDIYDKDYNLTTLRQRVGLVFQYPEYQIFETTILRDVSFGPAMMGLPLLEVQLRAFDAIKKVGISDELLDVSPFELSGGQKRRVAMAGVLAMRPDVLVLDEPAAGLDPKGRKDILDMVKKLREETGITVIMISHSMEDMAKYVDRLIVMDNGKIAFDDKTREVFRHSKELESMGLDIPQVTKLLYRLNEMGLNVDTGNITVEEVKDEILRGFVK